MPGLIGSPPVKFDASLPINKFGSRLRLQPGVRPLPLPSAMNLLNRCSIAQRLHLVFGAVLLLCLSGSGYAILQLRALGQSLETMVNDNLVVERATNDWLRVITGSLQRATAIARSTDNSLLEHFAPLTAATAKETDALQKLIEAHMDRADERAQFRRIADLRKPYAQASVELAKLKKTGDAEGAARVFRERFEPAGAEYLAAVHEMLRMQRAQFDEVAAAITAKRERTSLLLGLTGAVSLTIGAALAWALARSITRPLAEAERAAKAIGELDLSAAAARPQGNDELARLLRAVDTMRLTLHSSLREVRDVVESVSTASTQIASGNMDLSSRTEQSASNLQHAASAIEELTGTVRNSAESARLASHLTTAAAGVADRGGQVISRVVTTMGEIQGSSRRIGDIIGVIDGIAFQTNILALNAAVEAARAGEQGRGFAVVAGEVRTLAGRSAEAARQIKSLIGESVERVEAGAALVQDAGATMQEIMGSVRRVNDIVEEISTAAREQSTGIAEVNQTVSKLDHMTQQNAALVEESAAAAASLREQAERLSRTVSVFRLSAG